MADKKEAASFESSMKKLKEYADKMTDPGISLEDAVKCYENGIREYQKCKEILDETRQKVITIGE